MKKVILNILHLLLNVVLAASLFVSCWCFLTPYFRVNRNTQGDAFRNLPADTVRTGVTLLPHFAQNSVPVIAFPAR